MSNELFTILTTHSDFTINQNEYSFDITNLSSFITIEQKTITFLVQNPTIEFTIIQSPPVELVVNPMGLQGIQGTQGVPGVGSVTTIYNEQPAGLINGSNNVFTTSVSFQPGKVSVFINGLLQKFITHYQTTGTNTILLNDSLTVGDQIQVNYIIL